MSRCVPLPATSPCVAIHILMKETQVAGAALHLSHYQKVTSNTSLKLVQSYPHIYPTTVGESTATRCGPRATNTAVWNTTMNHY